MATAAGAPRARGAGDVSRPLHGRHADRRPDPRAAALRLHPHDRREAPGARRARRRPHAVEPPPDCRARGAGHVRPRGAADARSRREGDRLRPARGGDRDPARLRPRPRGDGSRRAARDRDRLRRREHRARAERRGLSAGVHRGDGARPGRRARGDAVARRAGRGPHALQSDARRHRLHGVGDVRLRALVPHRPHHGRVDRRRARPARSSSCR